MAPLWRTPLETVWNADRFDQAEWLNAVDGIPQLSTADQQAILESEEEDDLSPRSRIDGDQPIAPVTPTSDLDSAEPPQALLDRGASEPESDDELDWTHLTDLVFAADAWLDKSST